MLIDTLNTITIKQEYFLKTASRFNQVHQKIKQSSHCLQYVTILEN